MFYHASSIANITHLEPRVSDHGIPLVYFSTKRENTLVYLCNAVEKYCKETGFHYDGIWQKWGPYGFDDGILCLEEYYPDALVKTYKGVSGYIYQAKTIHKSEFELKIPCAYTSDKSVEVFGVEYVQDAYDEIMKAETEGLIRITRYEELTDKKLDWIRHTIRMEYDVASDHPEYQHFLHGNFGDML